MPKLSCKKSFVLAFILISNAGRSAYAQDLSQVSAKLADKLYQLCVAKKNALKVQLEQKNKAKAPIPERAALYKKLAIIEELLDQNADAIATEKAERAMLEASGEDKAELARIMMEEASPQHGPASRADEAEMHQQLLKVLKIVESDPVAKVAVLSNWVALSPWDTDKRNDLKAALKECTASDHESLRVRASGHMLASGYLMTRNAVYEAPKSHDDLERAFELFQQAKDPSGMMETLSLLYLKGEAASAAAPGAAKETRSQAVSALLKVLDALDATIQQPESRLMAVGNGIRNPIIDFAVRSDPSDAKKVVTRWMQVLAKVPPSPLEMFEDSQLEIAYANLLMGGIDAQLHDLSGARASFARGATQFDAVRTAVEKPLNIAQYEKDSIADLRLWLEIPSYLRSRGLPFDSHGGQRSSHFEYVKMMQESRVSAAAKNAFACRVGSAAVDCLQHQYKQADGEVGALKSQVQKKTMMLGLGVRPETLLAGLESMIASGYEQAGNVQDAAARYRDAWGLFSKMRMPNRDADEIAFRTGPPIPDWPPMSEPSSMMEKNDPGDIITKVLPTEGDTAIKYSAFLSKHTNLPESKTMLSGLQKLAEDETKRKAARQKAEKLYSLNRQEVVIATKLETDPAGALKDLRSVIDQRKALGTDQYYLVLSLNELGRQLTMRGSVKEAIAPLKEAVELCSALKEESLIAQPSLNLAVADLYSGEYAAATELAQKALEASKHDRYNLDSDAETKIVLAKCKLESNDLNGCENILGEIALKWGLAEKASSDLRPTEPSEGASKGQLSDLRRAQILLGLAEVSLAEKKYSQAGLFADAAQKYRKKCMETSGLGVALYNLRSSIVRAECLGQSGDLDGARKMLDTAVADAKPLFNTMHPLFAQVYLAKARFDAGDASASRADYEDAAKILAETVGEDAPATKKVRSYISGATP